MVNAACLLSVRSCPLASKCTTRNPRLLDVDIDYDQADRTSTRPAEGFCEQGRRETRDKAAASGMLPHEFLLAVTRGEAVDGYVPSFAERMEAAKAAAPFYAPKLSAVEADLNHGGPLVPVLNLNLHKLTDEQLEAYIRREEARLDIDGKPQ